ncbi:MAG TPA: LysR family transcriptional regulator [Usitatibacter sp.]|nr:LysR family transcriptional regulator [Usitatibacter sp.]
MRPDLGSLSLFIRVAEMHSITKAARASHIALAAASRRIQQLEEQLGVQLLRRSARGVELTPAGTAVLARAREMMAKVDEMRAEVSDYSKGAKGLVRIQANASALAQYLPSDLATFSASHPEIKLALEEERSGAIVEAVRAGAADVGIVMEGADPGGLQLFEYRTDLLCAVVPRRHPIRARKVAFAKLLDYDFVALESNTVISRLLLDEARRGGKPLRLRVQVKSFDVVARLVEAGLGIGVLPEDAANAFARPMGLRLVQLTDAWAARRMFVGVRDYTALSAPAKRLVDHLVGPSQNAKGHLP